MTRSVLILALTLTGCALPTGTSFTSFTGGPRMLAEAQGSISIALALPRKTQALPEGTSRVEITVISAQLANPIVQSINTSQFVDGKAVMEITKLPVGHVRVDALVYDAAGVALTLGNASAEVSAGRTTQVNLLMVVKAPSGGLGISVDTQVIQETPEIFIGKQTPVSLAQTLDLKAYPDTGWADAVRVTAGQRLVVDPAGRAAYGKGSNYYYYTPAGCTECPGSLAPSLPGLALLGRYVPDDGSPVVTFLLDESYQAVQAKTGTLQLGVNTKHGGVFVGWFTARVQVQ